MAYTCSCCELHDAVGRESVDHSGSNKPGYEKGYAYMYMSRSNIMIVLLASIHVVLISN